MAHAPPSSGLASCRFYCGLLDKAIYTVLSDMEIILADSVYRLKVIQVSDRPVLC